VEEVVILDVGHGNCGFVIEPKSFTIIDAPPGDTHIEELRKRDVRRVDAVLLSHADADHCGGLATLLLSLDIVVRRVLLNADAAKRTGVWDEVMIALRDAERRNGTRLEVGLTTTTKDVGKEHKKFTLEVLAPHPTLAAKGPGSTHKGKAVSSNTASVVVRVKHRGRPIVLFAGDIDQTGLDDLIAGRTDMRARILVFPHHGGSPGHGNAKSFAATLCQAVRPETVLFSIGRNRPGTPREDVVAGVRAALGGVRIACTQLATQCAASVPTAQPARLAKAYARGTKDRSCCAGSIVITLGGGKMEVARKPKAHQASISAYAPTALCRR